MERPTTGINERDVYCQQIRLLLLVCLGLVAAEDGLAALCAVAICHPFLSPYTPRTGQSGRFFWEPTCVIPRRSQCEKTSCSQSARGLAGGFCAGRSAFSSLCPLARVGCPFLSFLVSGHQCQCVLYTHWLSKLTRIRVV